eukprot:Rmarinus@m.28314
MKLRIQDRKGRVVAGELTINEDATVDALKEVFSQLKPKYYPSRQRFTVEIDGKSQPLKDGTSLQSYNLKNGGTLIFKDLGPQIAWSTVFLWEYFGPMLAYYIFYHFRSEIYGVDTPPTEHQTIALYCWIAHYSKREFETLFVHRFSNATMPIFNLFKNCSYYWGFAAFVGYFVNHPLYTAPANDLQVKIGLAMFVLSELSNFVTHVMLRNLRPPGTRVRRIPRGFFFELVSCPNYFFEITSWLGFNIFTQTVAGYLFMLAGFLQMADWALKKHRNYKKEFDGKDGREKYPRNRTAIIPFLL